MKNNQPLSLEKVKSIQVKMLIEFDKFCRSHGITYFLAYGTLLGAIRHKGYIPWDDDIDVFVPRSELGRLISEFNLNEYRIASVNSERNYVFPFPRMVDKSTYRKSGLRAVEHGVFIDIYPLDAFPGTIPEIRSFLNKHRRIYVLRQFFIKLQRAAFKILPISRFPLVKYLTKRHEMLSASYNYNDCLYVQACSNKVPFFPKSMFEEKCEVEFEGNCFFAPKKWDKFLTLCYGNYMELPPEDERHPYHGTNRYYWK